MYGKNKIIRNVRMSVFMIFFVIILSTMLYAETVDRIVAVVNDDPITQSELDMMLIPIYEQYKSVYDGRAFVEKITEARTSLLNQLIEDRLIRQEAKRVEIDVSDEEVNMHIEEVKSNFADEERFIAFLDAQHLSMDKLKEQYRDQIAMQKLHHYEVRSKVTVSPQDIETYYYENIDDFTDKEKIKARTIMIKKVPQIEGNDKERQLIDKIRKQLTAGGDFSELAQQYSQGAHASDGGALGFIERGEMIAEFDEVLFSLNIGELSPVLETDTAYHLFLVEGRQEKKEQNLSEVKDDIRALIYKMRSKKRYSEWIEELKKKAYISIK